MQSFTGQFDAVTFRVVIDFFGEVNGDAEELRSASQT